ITNSISVAGALGDHALAAQADGVGLFYRKELAGRQAEAAEDTEALFGIIRTLVEILIEVVQEGPVLTVGRGRPDGAPDGLQQEDIQIPRIARANEDRPWDIQSVEVRRNQAGGQLAVDIVGRDLLACGVGEVESLMPLKLADLEVEC